MMPSSQRLSRAEVTSLLSNTQIKVTFNRLGTLKYIKNPFKKGFSIVTGSKNQKKAVLRNKIRRQLYALFRDFIKEYPDTTPIQGILYVSKQIYEMSYKDLNHYLYAILQKSVE